ncbi:MAG TPA: hypothetical protein VFJ71_05720 [Candidatus Limnocylindrales bacterium]|nr:hypothetical protein [Candidatus Limnocylindrales bacterium]
MTNAADLELIALADDMDALAAWLRAHGQASWADRVLGHSRRVRKRIPEGVIGFLADSGGLSDVYFSPVNGNAASESDGQRLNEELRRLTLRPFERAFELKHAAMDASGSGHTPRR